MARRATGINISWEPELRARMEGMASESLIGLPVSKIAQILAAMGEDVLAKADAGDPACMDMKKKALDRIIGWGKKQEEARTVNSTAAKAEKRARRGSYSMPPAAKKSSSQT